MDNAVLLVVGSAEVAELIKMSDILLPDVRSDVFTATQAVKENVTEYYYRSLVFEDLAQMQYAE